jgi:hypothetical protein
VKLLEGCPHEKGLSIMTCQFSGHLSSRGVDLVLQLRTWSPPNQIILASDSEFENSAAFLVSNSSIHHALTYKALLLLHHPNSEQPTLPHATLTSPTLRIDAAVPLPSRMRMPVSILYLVFPVIQDIKASPSPVSPTLSIVDDRVSKTQIENTTGAYLTVRSLPLAVQ